MYHSAPTRPLRPSKTSEVWLIATLLLVLAALLAACGGTAAEATPTPVAGPAVLFFYTDN